MGEAGTARKVFNEAVMYPATGYAAPQTWAAVTRVEDTATTKFNGTAGFLRMMDCQDTMPSIRVSICTPPQTGLAGLGISV